MSPNHIQIAKASSQKIKYSLYKMLIETEI